MYVPYREMAFSVQTKQPRIMFEENSGLSQVWPVVLINEIIESVPFKNNSVKYRRNKIQVGEDGLVLRIA